jgi:hypothetical protein
VVPTNSAKLTLQTAERLVATFDRLVEHLAKTAKLDKSLIVRQALITPSCGTGSLPVPDAERVFALLHETSQALRARLGVA